MISIGYCPLNCEFPGREVGKKSGQGAALTKGTDSSHISQSVGFAYNMRVCLCGMHKGHLYFNTLMD